MKKGSFLTSQQMMFAFVTLFLLMIGIGIVGYTVVQTKIDQGVVNNIHLELRARQLINNPDCFAYEGARPELFVIDKNRFTAKTLEACLITQTPTVLKYHPAEATLIDGQDTTVIKTESWMNSPTAKRRSYDVFIQDGDERRTGKLILKIKMVYSP